MDAKSHDKGRVPPTVNAMTRPVARGAQVAQRSGRSLLLAYVGLWAALGDNVLQAWRQGTELIVAAEARGARMNAALLRRLQRSGAAIEELRVQTEGLEAEVAGSEVELEKSVRLALSRLGIPSRERLERLSLEIEQLTAKIDEELRKSEEDIGHRRMVAV